MKKFFNYLVKQAGRPDPIGDLADDFIVANRIKKVEDIHDLYNRIWLAFNSDAIEALTNCWIEFTNDPFPIDEFCTEHQEWDCLECSNN